MDGTGPTCQAPAMPQMTPDEVLVQRSCAGPVWMTSEQIERRSGLTFDRVCLVLRSFLQKNLVIRNGDSRYQVLWYPKKATVRPYLAKLPVPKAGDTAEWGDKYRSG